MSRRDGTGETGRDDVLLSLSTWQPWTALAAASLGLNFMWEMAQAPLYEGMLTMPRWKAAWVCAQASAGDAVITLVAYGGVAVAARSRAWLAFPRARWIGGYIGIGIALTIALEYLNVYGLGRWSYAANMPRALGVGIAPIAQWLILPYPILWLARRSLRREVVSTSRPRETPP